VKKVELKITYLSDNYVDVTNKDISYAKIRGLFKSEDKNPLGDGYSLQVNNEEDREKIEVMCDKISNAVLECMNSIGGDEDPKFKEYNITRHLPFTLQDGTVLNQKKDNDNITVRELIQNLLTFNMDASVNVISCDEFIDKFVLTWDGMPGTTKQKTKNVEFFINRKTSKDVIKWKKKI